MTLTPTLTLLIALGVPGGMYTGTLFYLNTTYIQAANGPYLTVKEFKLSNAEQTMQRMQEEIDDLEDAVEYGTATDADIRKLKRLKRDLAEWKTKAQAIKDDRSTA